MLWMIDFRDLDPKTSALCELWPPPALAPLLLFLSSLGSLSLIDPLGKIEVLHELATSFLVLTRPGTPAARECICRRPLEVDSWVEEGARIDRDCSCRDGSRGDIWAKVWEIRDLGGCTCLGSAVCITRYYVGSYCQALNGEWLWYPIVGGGLKWLDSRPV